MEKDLIMTPSRRSSLFSGNSPSKLNMTTGSQFLLREEQSRLAKIRLENKIAIKIQNKMIKDLKHFTTKTDGIKVTVEQINTSQYFISD